MNKKIVANKAIEYKNEKTNLKTETNFRFCIDLLI